MHLIYAKDVCEKSTVPSPLPLQSTGNGQEYKWFKKKNLNPLMFEIVRNPLLKEFFLAYDDKKLEGFVCILVIDCIVF